MHANSFTAKGECIIIDFWDDLQDIHSILHLTILMFLLLNLEKFVPMSSMFVSCKFKRKGFLIQTRIIVQSAVVIKHIIKRTMKDVKHLLLHLCMGKKT